MKRATTVAMAVAVSLVLAAGASAGVVTIDAFTDEFPPETFITNYSGGIINGIDTYGGLEVGNLYFTESPDHDQVGETMPPVTLRTVESVTQTGLAGVLGGQRTGTLTKTDATTRSSAVGIGYGEFAHSTGSQAKSNVLLEYGNVTVLNADFSSLGASEYFLLGGWTLDQGTVTATLSLTSGATTQSKSITLSPADYYSPVDYTIAFADFNLISFSDVDVIRLELVNNNNAQDMSLSAFEATPEPATMALLALGGIGMLLRRKR